MQAAAQADSGMVAKSTALDESLGRAHKLAVEQGHGHVSLDHLLFALTQDPEALAVLATGKVDLERLRADLAASLGRINEQGAALAGPGGPQPGADLLRILHLAGTAARQSPRKLVDGAIVLAAIIGDAKTPAAGALKAHGLTFEEVIKTLSRNAVAQHAVPSSPPVAAIAEAAPAPSAAKVVPAPKSTEDILASVRARVKQAEPPRIGGRGPTPVAAPMPTPPPVLSDAVKREPADVALPPSAAGPPPAPVAASAAAEPSMPPAIPAPPEDRPSRPMPSPFGALASERPTVGGPPPLPPGAIPQPPLMPDPAVGPAAAALARTTPIEATSLRPTEPTSAPTELRPHLPPLGPARAVPPPLPPQAVTRPGPPPGPVPLPPGAVPRQPPQAPGGRPLAVPPAQSGPAMPPPIAPKMAVMPAAPVDLIAAAVTIPANVTLKRTTAIDIRLPRAEVDIARPPRGRVGIPGAPQRIEPPIAHAATVRLVAEDPSRCLIAPLTPETVWFREPPVAEDEEAVWSFSLIALKPGKFRVILASHGCTSGAYGLEGETQASEMFEVRARRRVGRGLLTVLALVGAIGIGMAAAPYLAKPLAGLAAPVLKLIGR
jgi:hypothetical protein